MNLLVPFDPHIALFLLPWLSLFLPHPDPRSAPMPWRVSMQELKKNEAIWPTDCADVCAFITWVSFVDDVADKADDLLAEVRCRQAGGKEPWENARQARRDPQHVAGDKHPRAFLHFPCAGAFKALARRLSSKHGVVETRSRTSAFSVPLASLCERAPLTSSTPVICSGVRGRGRNEHAIPDGQRRPVAVALHFSRCEQ